MKNNKNLIEQLGGLNPYFVTGFSDAESTFVVSISKCSRFLKKKIKTGWRVTISFALQLHKRDLPLLKQIQAFFGVGDIYEPQGETVLYQVRSLEDVKKIINHFNKYPLITKKQADFELFKAIVELIDRDEHKTIEGLTKIISLRASMNRGLSEEFKKYFPAVLPFPRPSVGGQEILID